MNANTLILLTAVGAGVMLGLVFFGGLWWTVRRGLSSTRPTIWFLGSLIVRLSVVTLGFYFVGQGDWKRLAACLVGFIFARMAVTRRTRVSVASLEEESRAP